MLVIFYDAMFIIVVVFHACGLTYSVQSFLVTKFC